MCTRLSFTKNLPVPLSNKIFISNTFQLWSELLGLNHLPYSAYIFLSFKDSDCRYWRTILPPRYTPGMETDIQLHPCPSAKRAVTLAMWRHSQARTSVGSFLYHQFCINMPMVSSFTVYLIHSQAMSLESICFILNTSVPPSMLKRQL